MSATSHQTSRSTRVLIVIFFILTLSILTAGTLIYRDNAKHFRTKAEHQISAIANLKVAELEQWRSERLADAKTLFNNVIFFNLVQQYFKNPQSKNTRQHLSEWLRKYPDFHDYDQINLIDPQGRIRMSFPADRPPPPLAVRQNIPKILKSKIIEIIDLYRHDQDHRIYLSFFIPIVNPSLKGRAIGVISLRIDPEKYLFPFILRWPTPSQSAETLLVRRDGNQVLFLSELKFEKNAALRFQIPLTRKNEPTVMAVLGRTGIVEGVDYRGTSVISDLRPVPNSPWFLVTKMDITEATSPIKLYGSLIVGMMITLLFATGASLGIIWRKQRMEQLLLAKKAAENAAFSKAKFLDIAAHELRTPITTLSLLIQLAQKENGIHLTTNFLSRLQEPIERLTHLVIDLLDISRLERGMMTIQPMKNDMILLISNCIEDFQLLAPNRTFIFSKPDQPIEIDMDPIRINQVLSNLLDNAIKYTPAEGPIKITIEKMPKSVRVSVIDQGPGLSTDQLQNLFSAFSRGSSDATIRASGLGLGLSVCRGIIELHGGTINAKSELGRGSTFYFELPLKQLSI